MLSADARRYYRVFYNLNLLGWAYFFLANNAVFVVWFLIDNGSR